LIPGIRCDGRAERCNSNTISQLEQRFAEGASRSQGILWPPVRPEAVAAAGLALLSAMRNALAAQDLDIRRRRSRR
jgi:hypothetical protein